MNEFILENNKSLPSSWTRSKLDNLCELIGGGTPSRNNLEYFGGNIIWLTPTEIPKNMIVPISDSKEKITNLGLKKSSAKIIPKESVLLTSRASIGYVAIAGKDVTTNQGFASFICHESLFNYYLAYWLWCNKENLESEATGTTFKEISKSKLRELIIPLPPLNEQKRIVAKIEELFSLISNISNLLDNTKKQTRVYEKMIIFNTLSGKYTEEWRKNHSNLNGSYTLSKIFEERKRFLGKKYVEIEPEIQNTLTIPDSWKWTSLNNISEKIVDGVHFTPNYTESGIPFLSVKDIKNDRINFDDCKFISKEDHNELIKRCNPEFNDVLITKSGTIGRTAVINTKKFFSLFVSVALIKISHNHLDPYYLNYVLKNFMNHIDIAQKIKGGVIKNFHLEDLRLVPIPIPNLEEQKEIVSVLDTHMTIINNYKMSIDELKQKIDVLKSSILKTAFEGKLVPQDPNDEPAEILLQKIKQEKQLIQKQKPSRSTKNVK